MSNPVGPSIPPPLPPQKRPKPAWMALLPAILLFGTLYGLGYWITRPLGVEKCIARLKGDPSGDTRSDAARRLGELKDPRAIAPLIEALADAEPRVRESVIEALADIGDPSALPRLIDVAKKDADGNVQVYALRALGKFNDSRARTALMELRTHPRLGQWASEALAKMPGAQGADALAADLASANRDVRLQAAKALATAADPRALSPLIAFLKEDDKRGDAINALGALKDERAVEPLVGVLRDIAINRSGANDIGIALRQINSSKTVPLLAALLTDENAGARAAVALRILHDRAAVEPLIAVLKSPNTSGPAAEALVAIGDTRAIGPMADAIQRGVLPIGTIFELCQWDRAWGQTPDGQKLLSALTAALRKEDAAGSDARGVLAELYQPHAVQPLLAIMQNAAEPSWVRERAAFVLGRYAEPPQNASIDPSPIIAALNASLAAKDLPVLRGGARCYFHDKRHHDANVMPLLIAALNDSSGKDFVVYKELAELMYNCSEQRLKDAASAWAGEHGSIFRHL